MVYRGSCSLCGAEVECDADDTAILPYSRSNPIFEVVCPTQRCGLKITLKEFKVGEQG